MEARVGEEYKRRIYSVEHVLDLLGLVSERGSVRVGEAAEMLGVAPSTAHRLLGTLRHCGYVTQERRGGGYVPGEALRRLALAIVGTDNVAVTAKPVLERLREEAQATVSLLVLEHDKVRFVESIEGPGPLRVASRLGVVVPAYRTSGGRAMLAALSEEELLALYPSKQLEEGTYPGGLHTWDQLERELHETRRRGYGVNLQEGDQGIAALGASVVDASGVPIAAVTIACPSSRISSKKAAQNLSPRLLEAVGAIEATLRGGKR